MGLDSRNLFVQWWLKSLPHTPIYMCSEYEANCVSYIDLLPGSGEIHDLQKITSLEKTSLRILAMKNLVSWIMANDWDTYLETKYVFSPDYIMLRHILYFEIIHKPNIWISLLKLVLGNDWQANSNNLLISCFIVRPSVSLKKFYCLLNSNCHLYFHYNIHVILFLFSKIP